MYITLYLQNQTGSLQLPAGTYGTHGDPVYKHKKKGKNTMQEWCDYNQNIAEL